MNSFKHFLAILFVIPLCAGHAQLLAPPDTTIPLKVKDTLCIRYKFLKGDTLIYNIVSFDSIVINFDKPLLKNRIEKMRVICEDLNEYGNYKLSLELISYKSKESYKKEKNVEVYETPWLNRKIYITIDSVGQRMEQVSDDTSNFAMSPGGAFQPYLFFPFVRSCKAINETWIVNSSEDLVENGVPVPKMKQFSLFRMNPPIDTLNEHCAFIEFVKSAQGAELGVNANIPVNVSSVINGYGNLYLSLDKFLPIYYYATVEQKLSIYVPNEEPKPGWHFISTTYTLEKYVHADPAKLKNKNKATKKTNVKKHK